MTLTTHVIAFVAMALAIATIVVVGTLAAADILPLARRRPAAPAQPAEDTKPTKRPARVAAAAHQPRR